MRSQNRASLKILALLLSLMMLVMPSCDVNVNEGGTSATESTSAITETRTEQTTEEEMTTSEQIAEETTTEAEGTTTEEITTTAQEITTTTEEITTTVEEITTTTEEVTTTVEEITTTTEEITTTAQEITTTTEEVTTTAQEITTTTEEITTTAQEITTTTEEVTTTVQEITTTAEETTTEETTTAIETSVEEETTTVEEVTLPFEAPAITRPDFDLSSIPEYSGESVYVINNNVPFFTPNQYTTDSYEFYSALDSLGRCGIVVACIGTDIMPTDSRGSISSVKPTGWQEGFYERAHLIGWQLTGENANEQNLISGTYELNGAMQGYEDDIAAYVKETQNHVMYRVTPVFDGNNLLASGVHIEAYSVEDNGAGVSLNIYIYNSQTDFDINYATGEFELSEDALLAQATFVINTKNNKVHCVDCRSVLDMSPSNKQYTTLTAEELKAQGYSPCGSCKPWTAG